MSVRIGPWCLLVAGGLLGSAGSASAQQVIPAGNGVIIIIMPATAAPGFGPVAPVFTQPNFGGAGIGSAGTFGGPSGAVSPAIGSLLGAAIGAPAGPPRMTASASDTDRKLAALEKRLAETEKKLDAMNAQTAKLIEMLEKMQSPKRPDTKQ